jgi:NTE family protein
MGIAASGYTQTPAGRRPRVGVVFSGGGAKGLAHIGVLKVLEEAGIPIDYIGGTSMGGIVAGLYAIGYSSEQLDSIVRRINWEDLLTDKISRRNLSMIEKDEDLKYLFSFPIHGKKITLPSGIVAGQNISQLFSRLTSPVSNDTDFSKFNIPFLCVATDIENGKAVVLNKGNLAEAMRASMAIPTVFTPEVIDNKALLDGGLVNNFPVQEVKDMGADILIGVDVGFRFYKRNELNSMVRIIEQSIFMHSIEQTEKNKSMCQILISPKLGEYNASSFNKADSLIKRGERAALSQYKEIKELADYLHSFPDYVKPSRIMAKPIKEVNVKKIEITGLSNVPEEFILRKLPFDVPAEVKVSDIDQFVEQIYGTWFFEKISYTFEPYEGGVKLHFKVIEKNTNLFRVGLHYDNYYKTTLLLNTTFRNKLFKGSRITLDLALGENPYGSALFYKNTGWNPRYYFLLKSKLVPDYGFRVESHRLEVFQYQNNLKTASYNFTDATADLFLQFNLNNNNAVNLGVMGDYSDITNKINYTGIGSGDFFAVNFYLTYKKDSYDQAFYPSRGVRFNGEVQYVKELSNNDAKHLGFFVGSVRSTSVIPISRKISLINGIYGGTSYGDSIPLHYRFYMGGLGASSLRGLFPFAGLDFMQQTGLHTLIERLDLQWELWKDNFLLLKGNVGKTVIYRKNLFTLNDMAVGYGVGFGYRSPIGPLEINLMTSNKNPKPTWFINIGYWF